MKQKLFGRLVAVAAVLLLSAATASAHDFEVDGIYYEKNSDGTSVSVTYKGSSFISYANEYSSAVTIPASVTYSGKTYSVTSIGSYAFDECSVLTSVEIPNSVTSIGYCAFYGCRGLTSVEIPNSVTSIGKYAFSYCSGLTSVEIPNSVTSIGSSAFSGCSGLTSVEIPNSVTSIGNYAFLDCSGLTSVEIPNSVTEIGYEAFYGCNGLTSVEIPNSVTSIGSSAFYGCSNLASVEIPNSVTSIGDWAFAHCSGLTSVSIGNSVTSIGEYAFYDCSGLTSVVIPNSVTSISDYTFYGCRGLTSVVIPNSVTSIGEGTFYECSGLTSVVIPNSVTSIGNSVFYGCSGLTSVEIPNSITEIDEGTFYECSVLTSVEIPNSVTSIDRWAFGNCSGLTSVEIPNSVTKIGYAAFAYCSGLTSVSIGNSITSIGETVFYGCSGLKLVFFNAKKCSVVKDNNPSVGSFTSSDLTLVIGADVEKIEGGLLTSSNANKIVTQASTPPVITAQTFYDKSCPLYVTQGAYAKYWTADIWEDFSDMKPIDNPITKIELNKSSLNIVANNSAQLSATITPGNATLSDIYWVSDNPAIASVDQNGKVTGLKTGTTTITAMAIDGSGVKATCLILVDVDWITAENLTLNPSELTLAINQSANITPVITPDNAISNSLEWSTSNAGVAPFKANSDGSITVLGAADGVATITCHTTDGSDLTATCTVTVGTGAVDGIEADAAKVRGDNGVIRVDGVDGARVEVFNTAGVCIYSGTDTEIYVPQRGLYVVKVAGRATKLAL